MKRSILTLLIALPLFSFCQKTTFYGQYVDLYKGKKFVYSQEYATYIEGSSIKPRLLLEVIMPKNKKDKDTLKNLLPETIQGDTLIFENKSFSKIVNEYTKSESYRLPIKNLKNNKRYYFEYDPFNKYDFPFAIIDSLEVPKNLFCNEITKNADEFSGINTISTPVSDNIQYSISSKDNIQSNFINLKVTTTSLPPLGIKGVIILFRDGSKFDFPNEKILTNSAGVSGFYTIFATIILSKENLFQLKSKKIKGFRVGGTDNLLSQFESERYFGLFNCLITTNN
ncbi:hypothetical protein [Pedobacter borealis]|uniref:hypothetical protein n=1 Tax=Pedobacter borealis TaxID=475254 RepID=UPI000492F5F9|nr:hypothetical protein [Pedobacter borealis]